MKICVTAAGKGLQAPLDGRFGRAPFWVVYDEETGEVESLPNRAVDASHGAGTQAAQAVAGAGAEVLLTARCGPKAFELLSESGIKLFKATGGTVEEVLETWKNGGLDRLEAGQDAGRAWTG